MWQNELELTKHITLHANGEPFLKRSFQHSLLSSSATILLVWSANGDAPFQGKFQVNLLHDDTYRWNYATSSYEQIWKSLIYSMTRAFLERAVVELVYKFDEKSYCECLKRCVDR